MQQLTSVPFEFPNLTYQFFVSKQRFRPHPRYAGEIWKRKFHYENVSNVFCPHYDRKNLKKQQSPAHFGFVFEEKSGRVITWLSWCNRFRKAPFSKCFPSTRKRKAGVFKFLRFEERFRKAPFSWQISMDGRPNRRNKAALSNYSGVVRGRCLRGLQVIRTLHFNYGSGYHTKKIDNMLMVRTILEKE